MRANNDVWAMVDRAASRVPQWINTPPRQAMTCPECASVRSSGRDCPQCGHAP